MDLHKRWRKKNLCWIFFSTVWRRIFKVKYFRRPNCLLAWNDFKEKEVKSKMFVSEFRLKGNVRKCGSIDTSVFIESELLLKKIVESKLNASISAKLFLIFDWTFINLFNLFCQNFPNQYPSFSNLPTFANTKFKL